MCSEFIKRMLSMIKREPYVKPVNTNEHYREFGFKLGTKFHLGYDYKCPFGEPVYSVLAGEVLRAELVAGFGGYKPDKPDMPGGAALIRHEDKNGNFFVALYGHIDLEIQKGDIVQKGQIIGTIDHYITEGIDVPHLHFGIHLGAVKPTGKLGYDKEFGDWVEPTNFLKENC